MPCLRLMLATLAGLSVGHAHAAAVVDWTKLKPGMNGEQAAGQLGQPLIRTTGRGIEVWIYDGRGEAVFVGGPLKSWSVGAPSAESLARPVSLDVSIRAVRRQRLAPVQALPPRTYQEISTSHFRSW